MEGIVFWVENGLVGGGLNGVDDWDHLGCVVTLELPLFILGPRKVNLVLAIVHPPPVLVPFQKLLESQVARNVNLVPL
jgi:hypothetical protein